MRSFLAFLRWTFATPLLGAAALIVILSACFGALLAGVRSPETLKEALSSSGVYVRATDLGLDALFAKVKADAAKAGATISRKDILAGVTSEEELRAKLRIVFPPEWIEREAERIVDEAYAFVRGENDSITFSPRVDEREFAAQEAIADIFKAKLAALPLCASGTSYKQGFDLFRAECRPRDLSIAAATEKIDLGTKHIFAFETAKKQFSLGDADPSLALLPMRRAFTVAPLLFRGLCALGLILFALGSLLVPRAQRPYAFSAVILFCAVMLALGAIFLFLGMPHELVFDRVPEKSAVAFSAFRPFVEPFAGAIERRVALPLAYLAALFCAAAAVALRFRSSAVMHRLGGRFFGAVLILGLVLFTVSIVQLRKENVFGPEGLFGQSRDSATI